MSFAKRMMEDQETRRNAAISIAVKAGALTRCEFHPDTVMDAGLVGVLRTEDAYKLGNAKFTAGELSGVFDTRREMTDAIKAAIDEHGLDYCPSCDKLLSD